MDFRRHSNLSAGSEFRSARWITGRRLSGWRQGLKKCHQRSCLRGAQVLAIGWHIAAALNHLADQLIWRELNGDPIQVRRSLTYVVRSGRTGSAAFVDEIGRAIWAVNPNLPMASVRTMQEIYTRSLARTSFTLVMLAIAGAMALLLGVAGVYGVISYSVSQRTREIGIRVALGAQRGEVTRLFVAHGLRLAALGVGCGLAVAFALTRLMSSLLFDVKASDPLTFGAVSLGLAAAAVVASYLPALSAASVDPVHALRAE